MSAGRGLGAGTPACPGLAGRGAGHGAEPVGRQATRADHV